MKQSTFIVVCILVGFIVFITVKGELRQYLAVLGLVPKMEQV